MPGKGTTSRVKRRDVRICRSGIRDLSICAAMGSGELHRTLREHGMVDEYVLVVYPLVLGSGRRLFPEGSAYGELRLVESVPTTTGVVIGTYRSARPGATSTGA